VTRPHDLLLFDLDGTLSDPLPGFERSMNYALCHFGYAPLESSACSAYIGPALDKSFASITGITSPSQIKELVAKYRERYADVGFSENILYPGITEALHTLAESKVRLAVCTTKRKDFAERILEMFDLRGHFEFVSGGDIGIEKWQQIEALLAHSLVSESSVMIGDRSIDIIAARKNGLSSAGVLWGHGSRSELESERPNYLFASPHELPSLVALSYRAAVPEDIAQCIVLRGRTRDNAVSIERLKELGITHSSWSRSVADGSLPGYVCLDEGKIVGYCFGDKATGEIVVLALLPEWEGKGIGRCLLNKVVADFVRLGFKRLFLGCSAKPEHRSHGFYRHLGWSPTGIVYANQDEELEYFPERSRNS
jgi:phosphoglycolate phosphatase